ncbi:MAG: hypothetical protein KTR14_06850 [Vampirovibrio sp.]|nr:hypothetical protein [Vampirovibrio sp.]
MTILILGAPDEPHAAFIHQKLTQQGETAVYVDTRLFPAEATLSLTPDNNTPGTFQPDSNSPSIDLTTVKSVYWRTHLGIKTPAITDDFARSMAHREIESALGSLFRNLDCLWVNSAEAVIQHQFKGHQLQLLSRNGLRVPKTLMTNDPKAVPPFYEACDGKMIYKPIRGGAHTQQIKPEDMAPERLKELDKSPVQFQEMIDGTDIRVYLVGDALFAAEMQTQALDFRDDPQVNITPITLPDGVASDCHTLAKTLGLVFSGIDLRRSTTGEYVFIEGNPSPMFLHFEAVTGYPISASLVEMLVKGLI